MARTMKDLSLRQQRILDFIRRFIDDRNCPPTIRDILIGCGVSSTSVVDYNLRILEREGYLRRRRDIARGIQLLGESLERRGMIPVPIVGQIAAGQPIPVPSADSWDAVSSAETMEISESLVGGRKDIYALKVKGKSMLDALIDDGDIVVIQHVNAVDNGEMAVVWLKHENEATLKKFYAESGYVRLQPANDQMSPIYLEPDNVEVQGKVVAVIRQLT